MRKLKFTIPVFIVIGGLLLCSSLSFGKPEYTKKEKKGCPICHVAGTKNKGLTEAGKYYKEHKSLEGYQGGATKDTTK